MKQTARCLKSGRFVSVNVPVFRPDITLQTAQDFTFVDIALAILAGVAIGAVAMVIILL